MKHGLQKEVLLPAVDVDAIQVQLCDVGEGNMGHEQPECAICSRAVHVAFSKDPASTLSQSEYRWALRTCMHPDLR